jgi:hypothetical protein
LSGISNCEEFLLAEIKFIAEYPGNDQENIFAKKNSH